MSLCVLCVLILCFSACALLSPNSSGRTVLPVTVPGHRVYSTGVEVQSRRIMPFEALADILVQADVVALGEEHYHPDIQAFALRLLQALTQRQPQRLALAMEFLERDQQSAVDEYVHERIEATAFQTRLGASAAFMRSYFPLIDYARQQRLPVLAMNVPRRIARQVAREGLSATLQHLSPPERAYLPATLAPVAPTYRTYFLGAVASHHTMQGELAERFVEASHLKDDTMAEVLAQFLDQHRGFTVLALAGRFHVDYGTAIPALLQQRRPHLRVVRMTTIAVDANSLIDFQQFAREALADYLWFTPPAPQQSHRPSPRAPSQYQVYRIRQPGGEIGGGARLLP